MAKKYSQAEIIKRETRFKHFVEVVLPFLGFEFDVETPNPHCYKVLNTGFGNLTIYPKGDMIQLQNGTWIRDNIIGWLNTNVLTEKVPNFPIGELSRSKLK